MLVVFYGNDTVKVRQKAHDFAETKRDEGFSLADFDVENLDIGRLAAAANSSSLFGGRELYILDTPSLNNRVWEEMTDSLELLADSAHIFLVIEGPLLAAAKKDLERCATQMDEYKKSADVRFNNFALADALAKRDKKLLWLLLSEARLEGVSDEEIIGILWWQLKTMRLAAASSSANAVGLKDFPYNKAKRALSKFRPGEIEDLSRALLTVLHETRAGNGDLGVVLERYVLSI